MLERIFDADCFFFFVYISSEYNFKDIILKKNLIISFFFSFDADYSTIEYLHNAYLHRYIIKEYLFTKYVSDRVNILRRDFDKTSEWRSDKSRNAKKYSAKKALRPAIAHLRNAESIKANDCNIIVAYITKLFTINNSLSYTAPAINGAHLRLYRPQRITGSPGIISVSLRTDTCRYI